MKAVIFDLDGTLIDTVYAHTLAWQQTLAESDLPVPAWEIHRYIGMSGKLLVRALGRARGRTFDDSTIRQLEERHDALFRQSAHLHRPLPGAIALLAFLRQVPVVHGIATTGKRPQIAPALAALGIGESTRVVDGTATAAAKPEPDLFLRCQEQLDVPGHDCVVIGDAVWDIHAARRAGIAAAGVLTGGVSAQELFNAGAMRVYRDAAQFDAAYRRVGAGDSLTGGPSYSSTLART